VIKREQKVLAAPVVKQEVPELTNFSADEEFNFDNFLNLPGLQSTQTLQPPQQKIELQPQPQSLPQVGQVSRSFRF
jgi:hypothetical protein